MPGFSAPFDLIDQYKDTAERVRKLEIMPMRSLAPKHWGPHYEEPDAFAQLILMLGLWNNIGSGGVAPHSGPAAQWMHAKVMEQGFEFDEIAQDWTFILRYVGGLPSSTMFNGALTNQESFHWPTGYPDPQGAYGLFQWGNDVSGGIGTFASDSRWHRNVYYGGIGGAGAWQHVDAGTVIGQDFIETELTDAGPAMRAPNENGRQVDRRVYNYEPYKELIAAGGLRGNFDTAEYPNGDPIAVRLDHTYGFLGSGDCLGPNRPTYNPYEFPGKPLEYNSGNQPCTKGNELGASFYNGMVVRYSMWLGDFDWFCIQPPFPVSGWSTGADDGIGEDFGTINRVPWERTEFPGIEWLMETIELLLPATYFLPIWRAYYEPVAYAEAQARTHFNHLALRLGPGWFGRIEAQIRDGLCVLRGGATCYTDQLGGGSQPLASDVALWPVSFNPGSWPEWHGYVLPELPEGAAGSPRFEGRTREGGFPVPFSMTTASNGVRFLMIDANWASQYDHDHMTKHFTQEFSFVLDGASFPVIPGA